MKLWYILIQNHLNFEQNLFHNQKLIHPIDVYNINRHCMNPLHSKIIRQFEILKKGVLVPNTTFVLMISTTLYIIIKNSCVLWITIPLLIHNTPFILYSFNIYLVGMKKISRCQVLNINHIYLNVNIEDILTILIHCKGTLSNIVSKIYLMN